MNLTVNGVQHEVESHALRPLLHVLREELGITSPKAGCQQGGCGTCTVLVDGEPRRSCLLPLAAVDGAAITTVEGLGTPQQLAPVQAAFHEKYGSQGLAVLGFPCNDFGHQDPGTNAEILAFCTGKYDVKFDMFSKVVVKGNSKTPLYDFLISKETDPKFGGEIGWNFTKFLIDREGNIVGRFDSKTKPDSEALTKALEAELAKK